MTIEQATVKMLASLNLRDELAIDMCDLAIVSVIGYAAVRRILNSDNFPVLITNELDDLFDELDHMNINEIVADFLGGSNENTNQDTV